MQWQYKMSVGFAGSTVRARLLKILDIAAFNGCAGNTSAEETKFIRMHWKWG
jgi:hypothetical protein